MRVFFKTSAMRFSASLGVLGLMGVASAIPAAASTIDLNSGDGSVTYQITANTLSPTEGAAPTTPAVVITSLGGGWVNTLGSEWIGPTANQSGATASDAGYVTYQDTFSLPTGLNPGSTISIAFAADDWTTVTLNGTTFYTGPAGCNDSTGACGSTNPTSWTSNTTLTIPGTVDALLTSGSNTLSFTVWDTGGGADAGGGPTGLDAQVSVNYSVASTTVPEPSTMFPVAVALAFGFAFWLRRRRIDSAYPPVAR